MRREAKHENTKKTTRRETVLPPLQTYVMTTPADDSSVSSNGSSSSSGCAHPLVAEAKRRRRHARGVSDLARKTRLCNNFLRYGACPHHVTCRFAHGFDELRLDKIQFNKETEIIVNSCVRAVLEGYDAESVAPGLQTGLPATFSPS